MTGRPALVVLSFVTFAGTPRTLTLCREHRQRVGDALSAIGLHRGDVAPLPDDARSRNGRRLRCENCRRVPSGARS